MKISGTAGANHWSSLLDWSPNSSSLTEKKGKEKRQHTFPLVKDDDASFLMS